MSLSSATFTVIPLVASYPIIYIFFCLGRTTQPVTPFHARDGVVYIAVVGIFDVDHIFQPLTSLCPLLRYGVFTIVKLVPGLPSKTLHMALSSFKIGLSLFFGVLVVRLNVLLCS